MKKVLLSITASFCLLNAGYLSESKVKDFNQIDFFKKINAEVKNVYDAGSVYILDIKVQGMDDKVFITKDKKTFLKGTAINLETNQQLDSPIKDITIAKNKEAFSVGTGKDEYLLFTDPQCPYCKELEKYFPQLLDKVTIKVFYYPLLQMHPEAGELSKYQMFLSKNEKDKMKVLEISTDSADFKNKKDYGIELSNELDKELKEQMEIGSDFGIQGTPTLVSSNGMRLNFMDFLSKYNINPNIIR